MQCSNQKYKDSMKELPLVVKDELQSKITHFRQLFNNEKLRSIILDSDTTFMSDLKLNRDISLDFCTTLALRLIWCKYFFLLGSQYPIDSGPDGSAAQPALLKIVLHHVSTHVSEMYEKSPFFYNPRKKAYRHVTVSAFTYVRGWVFYGEIFFQTK